MVQVQQLLRRGGFRTAISGAGKEPTEFGAAADNPVVIGLRSHAVCVFCGAAAGHAEGQLVFLQQGRDTLGVLRVRIHLDGGEKIAYPQHILAQGGGDGTGRRKDREDTIGVFVAKGDDLLLTGQGLPPLKINR